MKDCKKIHPLLSLHLEGALSQKEKTLVEKHLAVCITARREREQFERMRQLLLQQPDPGVPSDLHGRIMSRLGLAAKETPKVIPWTRPFLLAAAMLMVVLFVDRLPEWKQQALAPDQEQNFAPQPLLTPMEQAAPPRPEKSLKEKVRGDQPRRRMEKAGKKSAPTAPAPASLLQKPSAGKDDRTLEAAADSNEEAGMSGTRDLLDQKSETAPAPASEAKSAAPEARPALGFASEPAEAERSLNNLTLSREFSALHWRGDNGPQGQTHETLLENPSSFGEVWKSLRPGQKEPRIDFGADSVIYLAAGEKPTAGYGIVILGLQERADNLVVRYRVQAPGSLAAQVVTHPWLLQAIPKPSKPVVFIKEE